MIYPYSFRKAYLAKNSGGNLVVQTSGTTDTIQPGEFGFCLCPNGIEGSFISAATTTTVKLVTGSYYPQDKIAPFYGGLQAPYYSKSIDFRRVTRFIQSLSAAAQQQIVSIGWDMTSGSTVGPVFYCGLPYFLRLDFLGSPALRLLNHQIYIDIPAYGGCCGTDCSSGCTSTAVDPACIMLQWKDFILSGNGNNIPEVPYLQQFFQPHVFVQNPGTLLPVEVFSQADVDAGRAVSAYICNISGATSVVAAFQLVGAYVDTKYGNCTFTPSDYFEIEPIFCHASLETQNFEPCAWNTTINTSVPNMFTQTQAPVYPKGLGEQVAREIILSERYRQNPFPDSVRVDSLRMREIEGINWILDNIDRNAYYDSIAIVYNIYRPDNSQAVHDNDQYCDIIYMPAGTNATTFTNLFQACLTLVGSPVVLEKTASNGSGI